MLAPLMADSVLISCMVQMKEIGGTSIHGCTWIHNVPGYKTYLGTGCTWIQSVPGNTIPEILSAFSRVVYKAKT